MEKIKRLPDAEFEIMKVVWTNEPPVTTTNLMVIRDESGQITSVANLIEEQAQKYDAQERPDMLYPAIAASCSLTDNRLAKSASVISGSSSPLSSSQSLAVSVSSEAAKAHSHTSLAISKAAQALGHPA